MGLKYLSQPQDDEKEKKPFEEKLYRLARAYHSASNMFTLTANLQAWKDDKEDVLRAYLGQHSEQAEAMAKSVEEEFGITIYHLCPVIKRRS